MKKQLILLFLLPAFLAGNAQYLHVGINGGMANYNGDLIDRYFVGPQANAYGGISLQYELGDQFLLRSGFNFARVNGDDQFNSNDVLRARNLRFESAITEFSLVGEFMLFNIYEKRYSPYVFAGLAVFHMDPYAHDSSGNKVYLKPLSTEGQGIYPNKKEYKNLQPAIPVGGGVRFAINDNIRIGLELGFRKTFTDYLDDVSTSYPDPGDLFAARGQQAVNYSYRGDEVPGGEPMFPTKDTQRGGAEQQDIYYFTGLHLSFRLQGKSNNSSHWKSKRGRMGCPVVPL